MVDEFSDFAQELEQFLDFETPKTGDIRTGTIVSVSPQGIIVALNNLKRDGIVPNSDLNKLSDEDRASLKVDDEVPVRVVSGGDSDSLIVSIYQAMVEEDWEKAIALRESKDIVEVEIGGYNKGGLIAPFGRIRGFIPLSQVSGFSRNLNDRERQRRMAKMRGEKIPVKVIEVDRERRRLVFSQREGMREFEAARKQEFLAKINVGDVLSGRVRSIRDFGVFVDLGEADGLVHVSELAWHRVKHPRDVVRVGEEIEVKVLKVSPEDQRISLTRKPLLENPWDRIYEKYEEGQLVDGTIVRTADYGAFVELEPGVEGLLHITQLSRSTVNDVNEIVQQGEQHLLRVLSVDQERQRIRLSLKAVSANEQIEWMTRKQEEAVAPPAEVEEEAPAKAEEAVEAEPATEESAEAPAAESEETSAPVAEAEEAPVAEESAESESIVEQVTDTAADVADSVVEAATEVAENAAEAVENVVTEVKEVVESAVSADSGEAEASASEGSAESAESAEEA